MRPVKAEKRERPFTHTSCPSSNGLRAGSVCPHGRGASAIRKDAGERAGQPQGPAAVEVSLPTPSGSAVPHSSTQAEPAFLSHQGVSSRMSCTTRPRVSLRAPRSVRTANAGVCGAPSPHSRASLVGTMNFRCAKPPSHLRLCSERRFGDFLVSRWRRH